MRVAGISWEPAGRSRDILHQPRGITLIESTQIRRFSKNYQAREACPCDWRLRVSKLATGTIRLESTQIRWFS